MEETRKKTPSPANKNNSPLNASQSSQLVFSGYEQLLDRGGARPAVHVLCATGTWKMMTIGWTTPLLVFKQGFDPHERLTYSLKPHNMWSHPNNQPSTPQKTQKPVGFRNSNVARGS